MGIALLGATGVAGRVLLPLLRERGHALRVAARSQAAAQALTQPGVEPVMCDILDASSLAPLLAGCDAVINLATAIPRSGSAATWELNDRVRADGTSNLLAACARAGVPRLVQQSVAMLHCVDDSRPQKEDDAVEGYGAVLTAAQLEAAVMAAPLDWRIARGGLFYGEDSGRGQVWAGEMESPEFRIPGDGRTWHSLVHVRDFAAALVAIVEHPAPKQAYIVCDDAPLTLNSLYSQLARKHARPLPQAGGPMRMRSFRTSNAKLRGIGWAPDFPVLEAGLR